MHRMQRMHKKHHRGPGTRQWYPWRNKCDWQRRLPCTYQQQKIDREHTLEWTTVMDIKILVRNLSRTLFIACMSSVISCVAQILLLESSNSYMYKYDISCLSWCLSRLWHYVSDRGSFRASSVPTAHTSLATYLFHFWKAALPPDPPAVWGCTT